MAPKTFIADGETIPFETGDTVLTALLRAGRHPTGGGCLCAGGDCPHCLVTVDGVAYVRACQIRPMADLDVRREHLRGRQPPLVRDRPPRPPVEARHRHCDVVVIGQGSSGRQAAKQARDLGQEVITLDAAQGQEAVGIYSGPTVVARTDECTLILHVRQEIIVATGASEIQPAAPGNDLAGLLTGRAAVAFSQAGLDLGRIVSVGEPATGLDARQARGELVLFEGENGTVCAVVTRTADGAEHRYQAETVVLGLGLSPRDALVRMGRDLPVRAVGRAATTPDIPPCPRAGTVCPCSGVDVDDLDYAWRSGFQELELVKRATLAGTGPCQGSVCLPHLRSFLADRGKDLQPPFTARPMTRQLTVGEIAAGAFHPATPRTALHGEHLRLGAQMDRAGGWWRPWRYEGLGGPAETTAVRTAVSLGDVSTLGKFIVSGPDAEAFLEHLYPARVTDLEIGRFRYLLLLDERGYVLDDGLVCRSSDSRFLLTLTSAGSNFGELWLRDWIEGLDLDVHLLNQTHALGAINVTGPRAAELLGRVGAGEPPEFAHHALARVAGIECRIFRLSFTGELSYELHHDSADSVALWQRLMDAGEGLGIQPHGLKTLLDLRLEKGHLVVGKDTDFDSTPRRLDHSWAIKLDKGEFVGRQATTRTRRIPLDRRLVGLEMDSPAPIQGAVVRHGGVYAGYVTSSADSATLGKAIMLAWLHTFDGELPATVEVNGRRARRVPTPFYDPKGERARGPVSTDRRSNALDSPFAAGSGRTLSVPGCKRFHRFEGNRVIARPAALDKTSWPDDALVLRIAPDEVWLGGGSAFPSSALGTPSFGSGAPNAAALERIEDPHAIVVSDSSLAGAWLGLDEASRWFERACAWPLPERRPAFAQGAVAAIPVKLWLERDRVLVLVTASFAADLERRLTPSDPNGADLRMGASP